MSQRQKQKTKPRNPGKFFDESSCCSVPVFHAVEGGKGVEEHVEQAVIQQDVGQLGAGVEELQQHAQDVVHQRVLVQGVLDEAQHWDDAALPEGGDVLHFLQLQAGNTQRETEWRLWWISSPLLPSWGRRRRKSQHSLLFQAHRTPKKHLQETLEEPLAALVDVELVGQQ